GEILQVSVNQDLRDKTTRHHSAAHLLQSALTFVLGDGIAQAGSLVDENRTRFDFSYPKALKAKEILAVEAKIFEYVNAAHAVTITEMSIDEAKKAGAVALFSEKYGNTVRTVRMGEPSFELCGGTHVQNTAEIGGIKILTEASCSSGIRRIEMVVGDVAQKYFLNKCSVVASVAKTLKSSEVQIEERVAKLIQEKKNMENELSVIAKKLLAFEALEFYDRKIEINGKIVICEPVPTHDLKHVAGMARALSDKAVDSVVLFTEDGGIVIATQKGGVNAREIFEKIKEIAGGNGGGSPFFLQGKGVNLERFPEIRGIVEGSV
ncbi:TPA: alanine--tRNA ligase, partial [Candidatus Gracilibacteria bacterium]|nr:alanine--tRNA ligase [Candidatus Gracilibacteria bacterium]